LVSLETSLYLSGGEVDFRYFVDFLHDVAEGCNVVIHRDRDFMTDIEVETIGNKITEASALPFITCGSDIESYYISAEHLAECLNEDVAEITGWVNDLASTHHIDVQHQFTRKRDEIKYSMYRGNHQDCPDTLALMKNNVPLSQDKRKGKYMLKKIRGNMNSRFHKTTDLITNTNHLSDPSLASILQEIEA
jgi:hypothetical protein